MLALTTGLQCWLRPLACQVGAEEAKKRWLLEAERAQLQSEILDHQTELRTLVNTQQMGSAELSAGCNLQWSPEVASIDCMLTAMTVH